MNTDAGGGEWIERSVAIDSTGIETQTGQPSEPNIWTIDDMGDRLLAVGNYGGGLALWESDGRDPFTPVYSEVCCSRFVTFPHAAAFGDRWLIGGSERIVSDDGEIERSFVSVSDDAGRSWMIVDDPLFTDRATRIDGFLVAGDVVIVEAVVESGSGTPVSIPAWSTDLTTWTPIELPGATRTEGLALYAEGSSVWAVASVLGPDGEYMLWASDDGGRSFGLGSKLAVDSWAMTRVADRLVSWPSGWQSVYHDIEARSPTLIATDGVLTELPVDTGQWGDGDVRFVQSVTDPNDGRVYGLVGRERYASVQYCYVDPSGCWQREAALVTTTDGTDWLDVAAPELDTFFGYNSGLSARADGSIRVWTWRDRSPTVDVFEWTGPAPPPMVDPIEYPAPDRSVPIIDHDTRLNVGDTVRFPLEIGGCGGLFMGATSWESDQPLPDPIPSEWPSRTVQITDGPSAYVFGTITLVTRDTIEFGIDGVGTVATFHPRIEEPEYVCG